MTGLGGVFAGGQAYVALSRCTSMEGISLKEPIRWEDIFIRKEVVNFAKGYNDDVVLNTALKQSKADKQYHDTIMAFDNGNMQSALDNFFLAIHSRYDIEKPSVIRYIRKKLNIINELRKQNEVLAENIKKRDKFLMKLAAEYVIMAKECEAANMKEAAIKNYQKALELYPSLSEAKKKMNKLMKE